MEQRAIREVQNANLKMFQPGESGNPKGRPKRAVTTLLKERSDEDNKVLADKLWSLAISGDMPAIREILDRTEGKVSSELNITGSILHSTPEMMLQAQERLKRAQEETNKLLKGGNDAIQGQGSQEELHEGLQEGQ